ncbi:uncharacterized protein cnk [Epargyreus clarus]|uniref:uncharacterized protein cnk n=1 Tax=Epargyreus clarus TaxID=520877 RepID=UPI003C2F41FB
MNGIPRGAAGAAAGAGAAARGEAAASSSDDSEPLSPPASPTQLHLDRARLYPPKPAAAALRRHTVSGGSPVHKRPALTIDQFWQELQQRRWVRGGSPENDDATLYRRDKAVSCSTGLQLSPRPRTCLGVPRAARSPSPAPAPPPAASPARGKLDKSHSTPAYDFDAPPDHAPIQPIPESPTTPPTDSPTLPQLEKAGQILDFKKSSSQLQEAMLQRSRRAAADEEPLQAVNPVLLDAERATPDGDSSSLVSPKIVIEDTLNSDEAKIIPIRFPKPRMADRWKPADVPPEPPPRPPSTQRPQPKDPLFSPSRDVIPVREPRDSVQSPVTPLQELASRELPLRDYTSPSRDFGSFREPISPVKDVVRESVAVNRDTLLSERDQMSPSRDVMSPSREMLSPMREQIPLVREPMPSREVPVPQYPALRMIPRPPNENRELTPLKPVRPGDTIQISVPLRHITKHDIKLIANERRELPAINGEPERGERGAERGAERAERPERGERAAERERERERAERERAERDDGALSPGGSGVRGIFPTSKSRSLKKKNSILAKRRDIGARALLARGAAAGAGGAVWQRVRARGASQPRWARRHLLLAHNLLYAYRSPDSLRAACLIALEGFTACAAAEVRSRAHAFKVYHTGKAFYFATEQRDAMLAWIHLIHRATLLAEPRQMELSKQFSETEYSDTESDNDSSEKKSEKEKEREKEKDKDKDKDKSKFGSLKKLTHRMQRSESQENVGHSSTSLDRKYLRFFSRNKSKDDSKTNKNKQSGVPVPTEHYRSYRRVAPPPGPAPAPGPAPRSPPQPRSDTRASKRIPKPINYIHASNPNLLDFEKSDFITKPTFHIPKPKSRQVENIMGFVTLEEFMLKKQEEERRQVYTNRVLMGIERDRHEDRKAAHELQQRLARVVPDVIYGELPDAPAPERAGPERAAPERGAAELQARSLPRTPDAAPDVQARGLPAKAARDKPISVKGKDGYEKIVYPEERAADWRDSLRRNDKVHSGVSSPSHAQPTGDSWSGANNGTTNGAHSSTSSSATSSATSSACSSAGAGPGAGQGVGAGAGPGAGVSRLRQMFGGGRREAARQESGRSVQYPHLQCPPTFQPETYSLARLAPRRARAERPERERVERAERPERERPERERPERERPERPERGGS